MSHTRMTTLAFLLLELSPFCLKIVCPFVTWNILIVLGRNVEQDKMTCHKQE